MYRDIIFWHSRFGRFKTKHSLAVSSSFTNIVKNALWLMKIALASDKGFFFESFLFMIMFIEHFIFNYYIIEKIFLFSQLNKITGCCGYNLGINGYLSKNRCIRLNTYIYRERQDYKKLYICFSISMILCIILSVFEQYVFSVLFAIPWKITTLATARLNSVI